MFVEYNLTIGITLTYDKLTVHLVMIMFSNNDGGFSATSLFNHQIPTSKFATIIFFQEVETRELR